MYNLGVGVQGLSKLVRYYYRLLNLMSFSLLGKEVSAFVFCGMVGQCYGESVGTYGFSFCFGGGTLFLGYKKYWWVKLWYVLVEWL